MRKLVLVVLGVAFAAVVNAQIIEPLQNKYDNKISPDTYIDPSLLKGDVIISNSKGDKLMSCNPIAMNIYYVAIKLANGGLYYGLVFPKYLQESNETIDILNGLKIDGQIVHPDGKVEDVYLYRNSDEIAKDATLFRNNKFVIPSLNSTFIFASNGTGKYTRSIHNECMAPQTLASSWREGYTTHYGYSGGYYFSVKGTCVQNITWKVVGDWITINYVNKGVPNVKATLHEMKPEPGGDHWEIEYKRQLNAQFRADFPTNEDVKKSKKEVYNALIESSSKGVVKYRFINIDGVGMVLFPATESGFDYSFGLVLQRINPENGSYNNVFDLESICKSGKEAYKKYRRSLVTSHQRIYNAFVSNIRNLISNPGDNLNALIGLTWFSIYDVNPYEKVAEMFYIRQRDGISQLCRTKVHFTGDGDIILEALNEKYIAVSDEPYATRTIIEQQNACLMQKQNKKNKAFKSHYAEYAKMFKKENLQIKFLTLDDLEKVSERLDKILQMQNKYLMILENCK